MSSELGGFIGHLLHRVYQRANRVAGDVMPKGTHPREFAVLGVLSGSDATSQQELAERLGINRTVMVKLIDKLEKRGYAVRTRSPEDRRSYQLSVTELGKEAMARMAPAMVRGEQLLTASLSGAQRAELNGLLVRMMPELGEALPGDGLDRTPYLLIQAHLRLRRRGDDALSGLGLTTRHFTALTVIDQFGPCPQQRLATEMGITEPITVQLVDFLQGAGLVLRGQDPQDRRRYALTLTPLGIQRLTEAREALDTIQSDLIVALGPAGEAELRKLLEQLIA